MSLSTHARHHTHPTDAHETTLEAFRPSRAWPDGLRSPCLCLSGEPKQRFERARLSLERGRRCPHTSSAMTCVERSMPADTRLPLAGDMHLHSGPL